MGLWDIYCKRTPQIDEVGIIIDINNIQNKPIGYVVKKSDEQGIPIWIADFYEDEIGEV